MREVQRPRKVVSGFKYPLLLSRDTGLVSSRSEFSRHLEALSFSGLSFRDTLGSEFFGSGSKFSRSEFSRHSLLSTDKSLPFVKTQSTVKRGS